MLGSLAPFATLKFILETVSPNRRCRRGSSMGVTKSSAIFFVFIICVALGCSKPNQFAQQTDVTQDVTPDVYPHTQEFKQINHGTFFLNYQQLCFKCHEAQGGKTLVNCNSCHAGYPISNKVNKHPKGWDEPELHGRAFKVVGPEGKRRCVSCHTSPEERKKYFGDAAVILKDNPNRKATQCTECHDPAPFAILND